MRNLWPSRCCWTPNGLLDHAVWGWWEFNNIWRATSSLLLMQIDHRNYLIMLTKGSCKFSHFAFCGQSFSSEIPSLLKCAGTSVICGFFKTCACSLSAPDRIWMTPKLFYRASQHMIFIISCLPFLSLTISLLDCSSKEHGQIKEALNLLTPTAIKVSSPTAVQCSVDHSIPGKDTCSRIPAPESCSC